HFFFSSRRRHTRFSRDWSSDVCSSDLPEWLDQRWDHDSDIHLQFLHHKAIWQWFLASILLPDQHGNWYHKPGLAIFLSAKKLFEIGRASCRERVYMPVRA